MIANYEYIDTSLRLLAIGGQTVIFAIVLFSKIRANIKIAIIGLLIGSAFYLINSSYALAPAGAWRLMVDALAISTTFWLWMLALHLFERRVGRMFPLAVISLLAVLWLAAVFVPSIRPIPFYAIHILSLMLVGHVMFLAISGRADDLVEKRRKVRTFLPLLVGIQVGGVLAFETLTGPTSGNAALSALNAFFILLVVIGAALTLLVAEPQLLVSPTVRQAESNNSQMTPSEQVLHEKLVALMEQGQFRETGLTIQTLADQLETPEHRLRLLINKRLGHRNFSTFLNGYRITEAKEKLSDRGLVDLPILSIAMDLGYGSLAPFNRAFRSETGVTPSDFRRRQINQN